jgi:hypothetical protein
VAPFAREAGVWDEFVNEHDFFELDPVASEAYYRLVAGGTAVELMPRLFLMGTGHPAIQRAADPEQHFSALHALAVRGLLASIAGDAAALETAGLVASTPGGYLLTEDGHAAHDKLLAREREGLDGERVSAIYERFLAANVPMKAACTRWQVTSDGDDARFEVIGELTDCVERATPALERTAELLPRFSGYLPRLREALAKAEAGEHDYAVSPQVDSVHTVWMEIHEDYLQTLGRSREAEGSY